MYKLELGSLYRRVQEEITGLTQIREVYNAANKVIRSVNLQYPGITKTELAATLVVANTSEGVTFNNSYTLQTITDQSASALPGDVIIFWDTAHNDGAYTIADVTGAVITIISDPRNILNPDTAATCKYAIYRFKNKVVMPERRFADVSFAAGPPGTITDNTLTYDIGLYGIEEYDVVVVDGTDATNNNDTAASITSVNRRTGIITVADTLTTKANDTPVMQVIRIDNGYSFDPDNHKLILPHWVKGVFRVFENNVELTGKEYEEVKDSDEDDELNFNMDSRNSISLPAEIFDAAGDELKVKVLMSIPIYLNSMNSSYIRIPEELDPVIYSGVMKYLLVKPKYKQDDLLKTYREEYKVNLSGLIDMEGKRMPRQSYGRDYGY